MTGWLPLFGSSFNAGKSQVNLDFLQVGGDYPFLNAMKTAQGWTALNNASTPITPDMLDSGGYPTTFTNTLGVATTGVYTSFSIPSQSERAGNYVVTWSGNGTVFCPNGTAVSGSLTSTTGSGSYTFTPNSTGMLLGISAIGSPHITNLQICHVNDAAALVSGQVFGGKFIQILQQANFGVVRFLNWQLGNTTNATTWATRLPISYPFYSGGEARYAGIYCGLAGNGNSGGAFTCTGPLDGTTFTLVDKATVTVVFTNTNTISSGTCSLNVAGTGGVNILSAYSNSLASTGNSYPIGGTYQSMATLVYDATLNAWIKQGGDIGENSTGLSTGVPPEIMVQLCAKIGAHPYFVTPPLAIDPATDYMPSLMAYCKANGPAWMIPRFEGPNELWNTSAGFYQTEYAVNKATAYGWSGDYHNWYGKVMSVLGQIGSGIFGSVNLGTKYQILCGVQTAFGINGTGTATHNPRLTSALYVSGGTVQSPLTGSWGTITFTATAAAPSGGAGPNVVSHVCCAQYFSPSDKGQPAETTLAAAFAGKAFVASIASGVMNVTLINASNSAAFSVGDTIFDTEIFAANAIPAGVKISSSGTGTGGTGTYNLNNSSITFASQNMTGGADLTAPNTYADTCNSGSGSFTLTACAVLYANWKTWAQGFGVQRMCGYEGGYSPDYTGGGNSQVDMLKSASKLDANLSTFITTTYSNFTGLTGGGFVSEFPSCFQSSGNPNIFGYSGDAWSVLEDIYQNPQPPQWSAFVAFNH